MTALSELSEATGLSEPTEPRDRPQVAVLFGGPTDEHVISCRSAEIILRHLDRERYEVTPVLVDRDGVWWVGKDGPDLLAEGPGPDPDGWLERFRGDDTGPRPTVSQSVAEAVLTLSRMDLAFPVFHGPYGEDGRVQALLELADVRYVGNGVPAGVAGMDKDWTKSLLAAAGMVVAEGVVLTGPDETLLEDDRRQLGLPVFVKPARNGSSIGVSRVTDWSQLDAALELARAGGDDKVLVEAAVIGREVDVAVLQYPDGRVVAGPPLEIELSDRPEFFDFDAKYVDAGTRYQIPARLDPPIIAMLQEQALTAFHVLGCRGLLRVDFFLRLEGDRWRPVVNEVNTFPGFTAKSQYPHIWQAAGMTVPQLLEIMVEAALAQ